MCDLTCRRIQVDEIWAFVGKKQRPLTPTDVRKQVGDQWTFVAIGPDTKLIPVHLVGKRDLPTATAFMSDLSDRLAIRVQLSSDALTAYVDATDQAFGGDVDYGQAATCQRQYKSEMRPWCMPAILATVEAIKPCPGCAVGR